MADEQKRPDGPESVKVVRGLEHVRKRPGMYIGDVGSRGLHWMLFQLVADSLAEAAEGYGRSLGVVLKPDGSLVVEDEGRGIDPTPHPVLGKPLLQAVLTEILAPGAGPPGRNWLDYAVANALSEWLLMESRHSGQVFRQEFRGGEPVAAPQQIGTCSSSGIRLAYKPDPIIFTDSRCSYSVVRDRLREYAFLHSGVRVSVSDEATGEMERFDFEDGIRAFVQWLSRGHQPVHPDVLVVRGEQEGVKYEVGLQWCQEEDEVMRSFVNDHETTYGGTHVSGFRDAVTRSLNTFIREQGPQDGRVLEGDQARSGLTAVVSVRLARPEFAGATKSSLQNIEAHRAVGAGVRRFLQRLFESNPGVAEAVVQAASAKGDAGG